MEATMLKSPVKEKKVRIQVGRALFILDSETVEPLTTAFLPRLVNPEAAFVHEIQDRKADFFSALVHRSRLKNSDTPTIKVYIEKLFDEADLRLIIQR
jgi:hypothetical protein